MTYDLTNPDKPTIDKDPDSVLDYTEDWSDWLSNDQDKIISVEILLGTSGMLLDRPTVISTDGTQVIAWLDGNQFVGKVGVTYRITTLAGRIDDRTLYFKSKER